MNLRGLFALEIVRYGMISVVAFAVDMGLLVLLTSGIGVHYLVSATASFIVGGAVAYFLSIRYVFRHRRMQEGTLEGAAFVALGVAGLVVNTIVMAFVVGGVGGHVLVGKLAAACCTFGVNFLLRKYVLFAPPRNEPAP